MSSADYFVDRSILKSRIKLWRFLAFLFLVIIVLFSKCLYNVNIASFLDKKYIARIDISGMISSNKDREKMLIDISKDNNIKAVIININSQGGTFVGSEVLYNNIRQIAKNKPVVAILQDIAASGGYLAALAADHIIAHNGTLTGSIGVIVQYVGVTKLANKLGVSLKSIKSSPLKASMSPLDELSHEGETAIQDIINDSYNYFVHLVMLRRHLEKSQALKVADGRVYTGPQALSLKLIDEIGTEETAIEWLNKKGIKLKIKDLDWNKPYKSLPIIKNIYQSLGFSDDADNSGLLAMWVK